MAKFLSYIVPVMMNFVFGAVLFITVQRFTDAGTSNLITALPLTAWALIYGGLNPIIGKIAKPENSVKFIMLSGAVTVCSSLGFLLVKNLYAQFLWMSMIGVAFAFYCVPFQIFAKSMESSKAASGNAVTKTAGRYTAAWSIGLAFGQLIFGLLTPAVGFSICIAIGAMMTVGIWAVSRKLELKSTAETAAAADADQPAENGMKLPDLAWIGWIVGGIGTFGISQIRTQLQPLGVSCGFEARDMAIMLFCVSFVQCITALALSFSGSKWQFRKMPALLVGVIGVIALTTFGIRDLADGFFVAAAAYGLYSGSFYFYFVFYSLSHPTRSGFYAGVNELVVSCNSIIAPLIGGVLAGFDPTYTFLLAALLTTSATVLHIAVIRKKCDGGLL